MPTVGGIYCPCEGRVFPADHYSSGSCASLPMPLAAIRSILLSEEADDFHSGGRMTVTRLLTCPREVLITDNVPLIVDVRRLDSRRKGTVLHEDLRRYAVGGYGEVEFPRPGEPAPTLLGEPISGRGDFIAADFSRIEDYKTHAESKQATLRQRKKPSNYAAQLNILRILVARGVLNVEPDDYRPQLLTWHTAQTSAEGPPAWIPMEEPYMSEAELGAFQPGGGNYTLASILDAYRQFRLDRAAGMPLADALRRVPLVGRRMFRGTKCPRYCGALHVCNDLEGIPNE